MKILITGATGFVGSNLAAYLVDCHYDVAVLLRKDSQTESLQQCLDLIKIYRTDGDHSDLVGILDEFRPEAVVHLASLFLSQHRPKQVDDLVNSNILFPTRLLEAMAACRINKLINTGTSWQHYENADYNPVNLYAATKQAFESICEYYVQAQDFRIVTLKLFETYGPGDQREKIIPLLLRSLVSKKMLKLSPGAQKLDIVHILDICSAFETAISLVDKANHPGHVRYAVSSGNPVCLRDLAVRIEKIAAEKVPVVWGALPYRKREMFKPWDAFVPLPGWRPNIPLEKGLEPLISKSFH